MGELKKIIIKGKAYPVKIDLNVLEVIQEEYGSIHEFERDLLGIKFKKDEDGQQIYDENGEPEIYFTEPSVRAIAMVLPLMINEGLAVEAHRMGKEPEWVEDSKILTECDISYEYLAELIHEEYSTCFVTKKIHQGRPGRETNRLCVGLLHRHE